MKERQTLELHISNDDVAHHVNDAYEMGITQVIGNPGVPEEADKYRLRYVVANTWTLEELEDEAKKAWMLEIAKRYAGRDRLVSINMTDEPIYYDFYHDPPPTKPKRAPEVFRAIRQLIRKACEDVSLSLAFLGQDSGSWKDDDEEEYFKEYLPTIDQIRFNIYPALKNTPLDVIVTWLDYLKAWQDGDERKRITVTLQAWYFDEHPRFPTVNETRMMAYLALFGGANTISFYEYKPEIWSRLPGFTDGFKELVAELNQWTQNLEGATVTGSLVEKDGGNIYEATVEYADGSETLVWINTTDKTNSGLMPYEVRCKPIG